MAGDSFPAWFNRCSCCWHIIFVLFFPYSKSVWGTLCLVIPLGAVLVVLPGLDPLGFVAAFLRCVLLYLEPFWLGNGLCPRPCGQPLLFAPFLIFSPLAPGLVDPFPFLGYRLFQFLHFLSRARDVRPG